MRTGLIANHVSKCCRVIFALYQFPENALVPASNFSHGSRFMKMQTPAPDACSTLHPHTPIALPYARAGGVTLAMCAAAMRAGAVRSVQAATPWPALRPVPA